MSLRNKISFLLTNNHYLSVPWVNTIYSRNKNEKNHCLSSGDTLIRISPFRFGDFLLGLIGDLISGLIGDVILCLTGDLILCLIGDFVCSFGSLISFDIASEAIIASLKFFSFVRLVHRSR
jgi:hypothetical protein